ncbi:4-hydroxythreonine-4-phosphate dehydrogenase PdxA [Hyphococcus flavus]|uniref:4-hydroxythreonine-4-phosphate dehydrogenase n=1 Tax=Hyphococcus flavus TaxID=1866326 RepID=A0AAE9ZBH4_9PROT|nr:4-hydroxythreonine-4-phosphate dehydrogenase PdxA [Hyphococcus flavus]WDI31674.1 4-hydroxythreonine-4-phosphate dehydrogenase PdxA [Hyphococcus flavus]
MAHAPLALTMGEPGGVGPEIICTAWERLRDTKFVFFVLADPAALEGNSCSLKIIEAPRQAKNVFSESVPVLPLNNKVLPSRGKADKKNAASVIESIERAVELAIAGEASGIVTSPIQKSSLIQSGFNFPGHTEFLAELTRNTAMPEECTRGPVMLLAGPKLKTVPVTIHQSVVSAAKSLTTERIVGVCTVAAESLAQDFGIKNPRLAVSGLNPHAGEDGAIGKEDNEIIAPAVNALKAKGINTFGPLPADTMFHEDARARYDAAICMLHDQALIPAKTLSFHDAVNVTLGLPVIRTSPDHGTALDIAGQGIARADSLIAAIKLASELAERRGSI